MYLCVGLSLVYQVGHVTQGTTITTNDLAVDQLCNAGGSLH